MLLLFVSLMVGDYSLLLEWLLYRFYWHLRIIFIFFPIVKLVCYLVQFAFTRFIVVRQCSKFRRIRRSINNIKQVKLSNYLGQVSTFGINAKCILIFLWIICWYCRISLLHEKACGIYKHAVFLMSLGSIRIWYIFRLTFRSLSVVSYSDECRTEKLLSVC